MDLFARRVIGWILSAHADIALMVPADALGDNIDGIMEAFKGFSDQGHGQATS